MSCRATEWSESTSSCRYGAWAVGAVSKSITSDDAWEQTARPIKVGAGKRQDHFSMLLQNWRRRSRTGVGRTRSEIFGPFGASDTGSRLAYDLGWSSSSFTTIMIPLAKPFASEIFTSPI